MPPGAGMAGDPSDIPPSVGVAATAVRGLPQLAQKVAPAAFSFPHAGQKANVFT